MLVMKIIHVTLLDGFKDHSRQQRETGSLWHTKVKIKVNCAISFEVTSNSLASFSIECTYSYTVLRILFWNK